jgi:hypothetical protein
MDRTIIIIFFWWLTNVDGFRGSSLPTNLHPQEHIFISYSIFKKKIFQFYYLLLELKISSTKTSKFGLPTNIDNPRIKMISQYVPFREDNRLL